MDQRTDPRNEPQYFETLSSNRTQALFLTLTLLFLLLSARRVFTRRLDRMSVIFRFFSVLFLFYVINFRTLTIRLTGQALRLTFGLFTWTVPLENVASASLDEIPALMRYGGAGIHFMMIQNRYRASFNFLEYLRIVVSLKRKQGPVQEISFSTRHPDKLLNLIGLLA